MKTILSLLSLLLITSVAIAQDGSKLFEDGNKAYAAAKFPEAIKNYEQALKVQDAADIHYNLGNAFYRTNQLGLAIVHYEKALKLKPDFEQARENLELVNTRIIDKIDNSSRKNLSSFWFSLRKETGVETFSMLTLLAWLIGALLFTLFIHSGIPAIKRTSFFAGLVFGVLGLILLGVTIQTNIDIKNANAAIVTVDKVDALTEPKEGSTLAFVIHEGTRVKFTPGDSDWIEITLENGSTGWVPSSTCSPI